jgi:ankyrin repeat protein
MLTTLSNKSRYVNVALQIENTCNQAVAVMSRANGAPHSVSIDDPSALSKAAAIGQTNVVEELLQQYGIDIDFRDPKSYGRTALHWACENGHLQVVKLLVEHGATIEVADNRGMTPLHDAASSDCLDVVQYLEAKGSNINAVTEDGRTILHVSAASNSLSILQHFLRCTSLTQRLSTRSKNGRTVLLCAVESGSLETARFILQRSSQSEILSKTDDGHTCLHYAVMSRSLKMVSLFQDAGICHHDQTNKGFTTLHYAATSSYAPLFRVMLDLIDRASITQNIFAYPTLIEPRPSRQYANGYWSIDDYISGRRLDLPTSSDGKTPLQYLLSADPFTNAHGEMVQDLVSRVGIDLERRDREKKTPLIALASRLSIEKVNQNLRNAIRHLLDQGVDPNAQDIFGRTALHHLCDPGSFSVLTFQAIGDLIGANPSLGSPTPPPPIPPSAPRPPPPLTIPRIQTENPTCSSSKSKIARIDIPDKSNETSFQAFFRNLYRTYSHDQVTKIAIRMLSLSKKDDLDRPLPNGERIFNHAIFFKSDKLIQKLYNLGVNTEERDITSRCRSPLEMFCLLGARDVEILRKLIKACKNFSELDVSGVSPNFIVGCFLLLPNSSLEILLVISDNSQYTVLLKILEVC